MTTLYTYYLPLYGMRFDSEEVGFLGKGDVGICRPAPDEWRRINKSDVWQEMLSNNFSIMTSEEDIPPCLSFFFEVDENEPAVTHIIRNYPNYSSFIWDPLLSLRLYKEGSFFNPQMAQQIFADDLNTSREPGPYRQYFLHYRSIDFTDVYNLSVRELIQKLEDETPLNYLYELVKKSHQHSASFTESIPVRNFHLSFGHFTKHTHRCSALFTCLEGIIGEMKRNQTFNSKLKYHYINRLECLLANASYSGAKEDCSWLDDHKYGARYLRNNIAHGNQKEIKDLAEQCYQRLQNFVRVVLKQYLIFLEVYANHKKSIDNILHLQHGCSNTEAFNLFVETLIAQNNDTKEFNQHLINVSLQIQPHS